MIVSKVKTTKTNCNSKHHKFNIINLKQFNFPCYDQVQRQNEYQCTDRLNFNYNQVQLQKERKTPFPANACAVLCQEAPECAFSICTTESPSTSWLQVHWITSEAPKPHQFYKLAQSLYRVFYIRATINLLASGQMQCMS